jgi:hypothetical protein
MSEMTIVVDAVQSIELHNGVYRVACCKVGAGGSNKPTAEIIIPQESMAAIAKAFGSVVSCDPRPDAGARVAPLKSSPSAPNSLGLKSDGSVAERPAVMRFQPRW